MGAAHCDCSNPRCRLTMDDKRHGTHNGYVNLRCRCEPCRAAHTAYLSQCRNARIARGIPEHAHGTAGGYANWGCRCRACTDANTVDKTDRKRRARQGETRCARGEQPKPKRRNSEVVVR